jgi:hypothetical protein
MRGQDKKNIFVAAKVYDEPVVKRITKKMQSSIANRGHLRLAVGSMGV